MLLEIKRRDGTTERVTQHYLEGLRMLMDWQLLAKGYDPASITTTLNKLDDLFALGVWTATKNRLAS